MIGGHLLVHWSRVPNSVALSSGEAELNASVKGITEVSGCIYISYELGFDF